METALLHETVVSTERTNIFVSMSNRYLKRHDFLSWLLETNSLANQTVIFDLEI